MMQHWSKIGGIIFIILLSATQSPAEALEDTASAAHDAPARLDAAVLRQLLLVEPVEHLYVLGNISDAEFSLVRTFLSPAHQEAAAKIAQWMEEAGLTSWIDAVGNVHGCTSPRVQMGSDSLQPAMVIGSHYDTVYDAGRYDGPLGIIVGISALKAALATKAVQAGLLAPPMLQLLQNGGSSSDLQEALAAAAIRLRHPVEVIAFSDEEGVRFGTTFLGSRAVAGTLLSTGLLNARDSNGSTLQAVLAQYLKVDSVDEVPARIAALAMHPGSVKGYVEVHMEQGPTLEKLKLPLAPVALIVGASRLTVSISGSQGHAGTVPMRLRRDPVTAAAEAIVAVEQRCGGGRYEEGPPPGTEAAWEDGLVCTVGSFSLWPGSSNVIAGSANFTIDIRCGSNARRQTLVDDITTTIDSLCLRRGVVCHVALVHNSDAVRLDESVVVALERSAQRAQALLIGTLEMKPALPGQGAPMRNNSARSLTVDTEADVADADSADAPGVCASAAERRKEGTCDSIGGRDTNSIKHQTASPSSSPQHETDDVPNPPLPLPITAVLTEEEAGVDGLQVVPPRFISGAGHDAQALAGTMPSGMLFVRCRNGGISHSPQELVDDVDVAYSAAALFSYLEEESL